MNKLNSLKKLTAAASAALAIALTFSCTDDKDDDDKNEAGSSSSVTAGDSSSSVAAGGSSSSSTEDMFCFNSDGARDCDGIGPFCGISSTEACNELADAVVMSRSECNSHNYSVYAGCMEAAAIQLCYNDGGCYGIDSNCSIETKAMCASEGGTVMSAGECSINDYEFYVDCMYYDPDYDYDPDECQNYIEPDGYCFNSVQDGECDPMPQYVTEEECRERPYAAVVDLEWCESANARAWKYCADNYYDGGYGKILPKKGMTKKSMLKKSLKKSMKK